MAKTIISARPERDTFFDSLYETTTRNAQVWTPEEEKTLLTIFRKKQHGPKVSYIFPFLRSYSRSAFNKEKQTTERKKKNIQIESYDLKRSPVFKPLKFS